MNEPRSLAPYLRELEGLRRRLESFLDQVLVTKEYAGGEEGPPGTWLPPVDLLESEEDYLLPYFAAAQQLSRPNAAGGIAISGAQFGASAQSFGQRLRRTKTATSSAPFLNELEGRLRHLNGVLKG